MIDSRLLLRCESYRCGFNYCGEARRFEARTADQRAIDIADRENTGRILRFGRAAIEKLHITASRHLAADEAMHRRDIIERRCQPRADRPDGLIGDDITAAIRQGVCQLLPDHQLGCPGTAFGFALANADDRNQAGRQSAQRFGADHGAVLIMVSAAFRVTEYNVAGAGILQHVCRNIARMRAGLLGMAVLSGDFHRACNSCCALYQGGRGRNENIKIGS